MMTPVRQRIAILGGGIASLATAVELTSQPGWQDRYDITVYQLGWRLGGKGASGRNLEIGGRIEEHGLHVWFGCYDRAFAMLRSCYEELGRPPTAPFATLESAFQAQNETPYFELVDGRWSVWPMWFPPNPAAPGSGGEFLTPWDMLVMLVESLVHVVEGILHVAPHVASPANGAAHATGGGIPGWLQKHLPSQLANAPETLVHTLLRLVQSVPRDPKAHHPDVHRGIGWLAGAIRTWLFHRLASEAHSDSVRRMIIELDLGLTLIGGLVADGVPGKGFEAIDGEDVRAWFRRHGAQPETVESSPIRALYDLYFAYEDGDIARPSFSAGVAIAAVLRLAMTYKGAVLYEMRAGMGEVVVAPIYEVLAKRGVKFAFFHRVDRLVLSADGTRVERVEMGRQAALADGTLDGYRPLIDVDGLPCWPIEPLYDQLATGDAERLRGVNLESHWAQRPDAGKTVLHAGADFDQVVLGISLAAVKPIATDLVAKHRAWADMFAHLATNQTVAAQLWMTPNLQELGWTRGPVPADAAPEPLDVWADRTDTIQREGWPAGSRPGSVQYVCGPLPGDWAARRPSDAAVPAEARAEVVALVTRWLNDHGPSLWPRAAARGGGFDWSALHVPPGPSAASGPPETSGPDGPARLEAQFLRANIDPTERYVLSLPGTARYRLGADESGCSNLVLTGDWTRTEWNVGCIEAATISGLNAAGVVVDRAGSLGGSAEARSR